MRKRGDDAVAKLIAWRDDPVLFVQQAFGIEPDPWQAEVLSKYQSQQRIAMSAPISLDMDVVTASGVKKCGSIKKGDVLFAGDGSPTRVVDRFDRENRQLYRVRFRDGTSVDVDADHEWCVQTPYDRKLNKTRTVSTATLLGMRLNAKYNGQNLVSVPGQGPIQLPDAALPFDPYLFGLWLGDGVANEPRLIAPDPAIRKAVVERGYLISESECVPKRIGLLGVAGDLAATGASKCRSYEKYIPDIYKFASIQQRLDLLRGLMDSDGTCTNNCHCYLASSSERLIDDFIWLARSLGYLCTKQGPYPINDGENRDSYRGVLCGRLSPFLARTSKALRWKPPLYGRYQRFIEKIEPVGVGPVMCVEVDHPSHLFQIGDFITTHNCKGPGKSAVLSWIAWHFLCTRERPKIVCTSITEDNLRDGLWTEMSKWQARCPLLLQAFEVQARRIIRKDTPELAWMSFRTWSKAADPNTLASTLAGLHEDEIMALVDESGGVPQAVLREAEGALTSGVDAHIIQAGNPISRDGALYVACVRNRKYWYVVEITSDPDDPKRTTRVPAQWAQEQIEVYGRGDPWVQSNILGKFPSQSFNTLIDEDTVLAAMARTRREDEIAHAPRILGVDTARFGVDETVIFPRQGLVASEPLHFRGLDTQRGIAILARKIDEWKPDAVFIDDTGGYGAGYVDGMRTMGYPVIGVHFSNKPDDPRFFNKRAEIYFNCCQWIKDGGTLPKANSLISELCEPVYRVHPTSGRFIIEDKDQVKARIGRSPDHADALALTFAMPVAKRQTNRRARYQADYNPFKEMYNLHDR